MTDQEIKEKYYEYKRRGLIRPPQLITEKDWDNYYRDLFFENEPSILEMKLAIEDLDKWRAKQKVFLEKVKKNPDKYHSIEF